MYAAREREDSETTLTKAEDVVYVSFDFVDSQLNSFSVTVCLKSTWMNTLMRKSSVSS